MTVYVVNDSLSRLLYEGLKLSSLISCRRSRDRLSLFCRHVDSDTGVKVEVLDRWNIRIVVDEEFVILGNSSYYRIIGGPGKTLFYALKTLANIPSHRSLGVGFAHNVEVLDYGDLIIVVLEDVMAAVGRDGYVSISSLFLTREGDPIVVGEWERDLSSA